MITISTAKRLIKRCILANIVNEKKDLWITPLISGKHGIGKSQMIKSIAKEINGRCITIEGGTLKEGEITGLPYQYKDEFGNVKFRFLPYYAIERIQNEEKRLYLKYKGEVKEDELSGEDNLYQMNNLSKEEKIRLIKEKEITPVIIFIDEINRTENTVYKELMNILLTKTVNGYELPWWVFFVGAMNPSSQNSMYTTNEMDPAQLDRFIKFIVKEDKKEWIQYASETEIDQNIIDFISQNKNVLSVEEKGLEDEEKPSPSPRGWDMIDSIIKSIPLLRDFFDNKENTYDIENKDLKEIFDAKLGSVVGLMFYSYMIKPHTTIEPEDIFLSDTKLSNLSASIKKINNIGKIQLVHSMIEYLVNNIDFMMLESEFDTNKKKLSSFISLLDDSAKLLFAQSVTSTVSKEGTNLMSVLIDTFDEDVLNLLDITSKNSKAVKGK